jgi:hypothetical protein
MSSGRIIDEYPLDSLEDYLLEDDPNASGNYSSTKISNTKQLNETWWSLQKSNRVQPNWGRIQQACKEEYETLIPGNRSHAEQ